MELDIETALNLGSDEFYRSVRYKIDLTVILINSNKKDAFNTLETNLRKSDIIQQLTSNTIIVFLSHTNLDNSALFIKKMKEKLDFTYTMDEYQNSEHTFLKKLFQKNSEIIFV